MVDYNLDGFLVVCEYLPSVLQMTLKKIPLLTQREIHEIRLRAEKPVCLFD